MAIVVSDTSPLRCVGHLRLLDLLPALFEKVFIPPAVVAELRAGPSGPFFVGLEAISPLEIHAPADTALVQRLLHRLHLGESEALASAVEIAAEFVLIDEKTGRRVAKELGLTPLGVLGMLVKAKQRGLIPEVAPLLMRLKAELDFRVSVQVQRRILELAGE